MRSSASAWLYVSSVTVLLLPATSCSLADTPPGDHPELAPARVAALLAEKPWESKGLTPVNMKTAEGLAPLVIAEGGAAKVMIVPAAGMPYYREVAEFLADYLGQATGVKFVIVAEPPREGEAIYVGPVERAGTERIIERARALAPERFIVERIPSGVILVGNDTYRSIDVGKPLTIKTVPFAFGMLFCSKGTYFAAVDFLERFVGVRWYFLGPIGTCVPDRTGKKLDMPSMNYEDGPWFADRRAFGVYLDKAAETGLELKPYNNYYTLNEFRQWGHRNGAMRPAKAQHTDSYWGELYGKDHLEYFALRADGTRMIGEFGREMFSSQRCYTSEAGFQQHLRNIEQYLATGEGGRAFTERLGECLPNKDFIYWAPNDGFAACQCPACQALVDKNAPVTERNSRLIWAYTAKLGNAIKRKWPGKQLCVFGGYSGATTIPDDIKLPNNVIITLTIGTVPECFMKEPTYLQANQALVNYFFAKTGQKVSLWTYPNLPYYSMRVPYPTFAPHSQAEFIRANRDKLGGVFTQEFYPLNALGSALYAKLLWNPDVDVDAFLAEYPAVMYGPAAPRMKEFLDLCVSRWENTHWSYLPPPLRLDEAIPAQMIWKETYPQAVRAQMQDTLKAALAAVPDKGMYRERVQYAIAAAAPFFEAGKFADEMVKPVIDCAKFAKAPVIDGDLKEWEAVRPVELKTWKGEPVKERTEFMVARDEDAVYIAGRAHEPEGLVLANDPKDRNIYGYDSVEIYLCPEQIGLEAAGMAQSEQFFQIALNARGETKVNRKTLQRTDWGAPEKFDFASEVKPMGNGFQFEIRIPYASMAAPAPREGRSEWFVNFYRNRPRGGDKGYQAWAPTMGQSFFETRFFGILRFPPQPLYQVSFDKITASVQRAEGLETAAAVKDGNLVVTVNAGPGIRENAPPYVDFTGIPPLPLRGPVVLEMAFRYRGKGVAEVNLCVKESYDAAKHRNVAVYHYLPSHSPAQTVEGDWIVGRLKVPQEGTPMRDLTYWNIGMSVAPGADFTLEVAYIKVFPVTP